ncbi:MAG: ATP-binding protein [Candidatus Margulisbacteria bacterium]|jgi:PAS domain S-box-containing protein|nr:ATP-binding protein [Candidatus Margulisiibacteriota bacterium]
MQLREIGPTKQYLRGKISRQYGLLTGMGEIKLGPMKRVKLEAIDTGLNMLARMELAYLWCAQKIGRSPTFTSLPLEQARVKLGEIRGRMKVNTIDGQALNHSPDNVCFLDAEGKISWVNATMINGFGYSTSELIGRPFTDFVHLEDRDLFLARWAAIPQNHHDSSCEVRLKLSGDGYIWGAIAGRVLKQQGKTAGAALTIRDVTERKEKEIGLILKERARFLNLIWRGMGHEVNNAFAPILAVLEGAKVLAERGNEATVKRCLLDMAGNAERIRKFTDRLQFFMVASAESRIRSDLRLLIVNVVELMQERFQALKVKVRIIAPEAFDVQLSRMVPESFVAEFQFNGLEMVMMDLLSNAIDAIALRSAEEPDAPRQIDISIDRTAAGQRPAISVAVSDTGCGIRPENRDKIFQPFFSTKRAGDGTGLGMAAIQETLRQHGGTVSVSSEPGRGTQIIFRLPV